MRRTSALLLAGTFVLALGCAKKPAQDASKTTSGRAPRASVNVADDLVRLCNIQVGDVSRAPKFDFDEAALLPEDRAILDQVARCLTTGPLKGRSVTLIGRADPRGEIEYNMVLGDHRADAVRTYLAKLGVHEERMSQTSRGELDAQGTDEETWRADRRVDIALP
jgi:peptidoglycan-associated lipoprotein